jgi:hypothetical protein
MKTLFALVLAITLATPLSAATSATSPRTTNNDDSCDISVQPAATLLLPYFDVDFNATPANAVNTLFTVQNVSPMPQIANVTIWTDFSFPLVSIPMFLTGYDVQSINMYDLLARSVFAPPSGTSNGAPVPTNPTAGSQPAGNNANPNFLASAASDCAPGRLPGVIPAPVLQGIRDALTLGRGTGIFNCNNSAGVAQQIGGVHQHAIGYITIDVVATCTVKNPSSPDYYSTVLLFDNVLTGDYQNIVPRGDRSYALGGPLVHIRAVPEGGRAGLTIADTSLPYTFYDRFTNDAPSRSFDRRQPLPSTFAPRYIEGGEAGFNSSYKIWREARTGANAACNTYVGNGTMPMTEIIRFDEHENASVLVPSFLLTPPPPPPSLPAASIVTINGSAIFPSAPPSGDVAGWFYMNLNNGGSSAYSVGTYPSGIARDFRTGTSTNTGLRQSQNWVITSMFGEPTYATESTAVALGNGCSPSPLEGAQIAPAANTTP